MTQFRKTFDKYCSGLPLTQLIESSVSLFKMPKEEQNRMQSYEDDFGLHANMSRPSNVVKSGKTYSEQGRHVCARKSRCSLTSYIRNKSLESDMCSVGTIFGRSQIAGIMKVNGSDLDMTDEKQAAENHVE